MTEVLTSLYTLSARNWFRDCKHEDRDHEETVQTKVGMADQSPYSFRVSVFSTYNWYAICLLLIIVEPL